MICNVIATGSTGNAVILDNDLLIDCGVPFGALQDHYRALKIALLTHIHGDHFNPATIKRLHYLRPALRFACAPWLLQPLLDIGIARPMIDCVLPSANRGILYQNNLILRCERIPHDVDNCCWHIKMPDGTLAFYATDCGSLDEIAAHDYDLYLVEANHTQAELAARLAAKEEKGEYAYERRAAEVHLSQEQAMDWLAENMGPRSKYILLHQHKEREANNGVVRGPSNDGEASENAQAGEAAQG